MNYLGEDVSISVSYQATKKLSSVREYSEK